ncbi:MAG: caspase family protein [Candidatus Hatepunaea meridiana]|nr:caspase family protein [Candidatus Hatepunaea meridiana]
MNRSNIAAIVLISCIAFVITTGAQEADISHLLTLTAYSGRINSVAFSPDGGTLASGGWDYGDESTIKLWRVSDGTLVRTLTGLSGYVESVAFSPDGGTLACGCRDDVDKGTIKLWRVSDGTLLRTLTYYYAKFISVAFSPDGKLLASANSFCTINLWRVSDGALLHTLSGHRGIVGSFVFSPDGETITSVSEEESNRGEDEVIIKLWRVSDGMQMRTLTESSDILNSYAFSPDGETLAHGGYKDVELWRVLDGALLRTLKGHSGFVESVAFSPDGEILAGSGNNIILWRVSDGAQLCTLTKRSGSLNSVTFSPDGGMLAESSDKNIKFWLVPPEHGFPPDIYAELNFSDENGDGIMEGGEKGRVTLKFSNRGVGPAHWLKVGIQADKPVDLYSNEIRISKLDPNESKEVVIPLEAGLDIETALHRLLIDVKELLGYDMDPAYLVLQTQAFQPPELKFAGLEIIDWGDGTFGRPSDGQLQAGEQVKVRLVIQNIGYRKAEETSYKLVSTDENIYVTDGSGSLGTLEPGETGDIWITISPNKRVDTVVKLPLFLSLTESTGKGSLTDFQLPLLLEQKPPEPQIVEVKFDMAVIQRQAARFEFTSPKFTARVPQLETIRNVVPAKTHCSNSVAVVIGVEKYRNLPDAPYAESDAELMQQYLKKRLGVEKVVLFKSSEVTGLFFDNIFNPDYGELQREIIKGKTELFVYYSGHGIPAKDGSEVYLFPSDGRTEQLEMAGYNLNDLYQNLNRLEAKSVTVILDACFSGASRASEKIQTENLVAHKAVGLRLTEPWRMYPNFTVINSSTGSETSLGFDRSQTGLFTYWLALGLQGKADADNDNRITLGELKTYVTGNVTETSRKIAGLQTPQFYGDESRVLVEW